MAARDEVYELVVELSPEGAEQTQEALQETQDTFEETADTAGEKASVLDRFARKWRGAMTVITSALAIAAGALLSQVPIVSDLMDGLMAIVEAVALQMDQFLRPALQGVVDTMFGWAEAIGDLEGPLGDFVGLLGTLGAVLAGAGILQHFGLLAGILTRLAPLLMGLTGPVGIAVALLGLLATAWFTNFMGIQDITHEVLGNIGAFFEENFGDMVDTASGLLAQLVSVVQGYLEFLWTGLYQPILNEILAVWEMHGEEVMAEIEATLGYINDNLVQPYLGALVTAFRTYLGIVLGVWTEVFERAAAFWDEWGDEITTVARFTFDLIRNIIGYALDAVLTSIRVVLAVIRGDWRAAWDLMTAFLSRTLGRIRTLVSDWGPALRGVFRSVAQAAVAAFLAPIERAVDRARQMLDRIRDMARQATSIGGEGRLRDRIPSLQSGGRIVQGGLVNVHAGEQVVPAAQVDKGGGGPRNRFAEREELVVRFEPRRFEEFVSANLENGPANTGRSSGPQG